MHKMKRAIHFDFHTQPGIEGLGKLFDAKAFAATLKDSHVAYINFFARCNRGFSYYPTKIGVPYPTENGPKLLPELLKECHNVGIGVTAYFNASINGMMAKKHPEWTQRWDDNRSPAGTFMCYNTPYAEHLLAEIKEVLEMYPDIDGIFADCLIMGDVCYCDSCRKKMAEEGIDVNDTKAVTDFFTRSKLRMAQRIRDIVPTSKYLYINGLTHIIPTGADPMNTHAEVEALTSTGMWGYECFPTHIALERNNYKESIFMTGRFQNNWGDFGGINTAEGIEYDTFTALANGSQISVGDHLHPYGAPEKGLFDIIKPIYEQVEAVEPWTEDSVYQSEIGVYAGSREYYFTRDRYYTIFQGVQRLLNELKYPFDIVTNVEDFSKYKVLILPDEITLDEESAKKIKAYLANGGKVLSTGNSGLTPDGTAFALPEWDFTPIPEKTTSPFWDPNAPAPKKLALFCSNVAGQYPGETAIVGQTEWLLNYFGYEYDLVTVDDDLSKYSLMILPDTITMDDRAALKVGEFAKNGGRFITLRSNSFTSIKRLPDDSVPSFFRLQGDLAKNTPDMVIRSYFAGTVLKLGKTAKSLAEHVAGEKVELLPNFQYLPYGEPDGYSSAAISGNVLHIGTKLFKYYKIGAYVVYKQMLDNALRMLYPCKTIEAPLPSFSRCTLTKKDSTYLLHVLSYCPESRGDSAKVEEKIELRDMPFTVRIPNVKAVYSIPDKTPLPFTTADGAVSFTAPVINGHAIFAIETK